MRKNILALPILGAALLASAAHASPGLTLKEWVGRQIFFDRNLSANKNQSCAACHSAEVGWTGGDALVNLGSAVYEGSIPGAFGNRKPGAAAYATYAPRLRYNAGVREFIGGQFWDGRATGWKLGHPVADQAQGPFLNPVEQALPSARDVVERVCSSWYAPKFLLVWGKTACSNVDMAYRDIALSISAFEGSQEVSPFSSKYDAYLADEVELTSQESRGLALFNGKAKCSRCHPSAESADGSPPLFTDFSYDNTGVPKNPSNPAYDKNPGYVDPGLGGFLHTLATTSDWRTLPFVSPSVASLRADELAMLAEQNYGKHRVPTLRNVAKGLPFPKAFAHNGFFKTLKGFIHYYNTRDTLMKVCPAGSTEAYALANQCWPPPEATENMNRGEMGNLSLTPSEEDALVAFLGTLSDGYDP